MVGGLARGHGRPQPLGQHLRPGRVGPGATTMNSSPPTRPSASVARIAVAERLAEPDQDVVPAGEQVAGVDLLELVGVDQPEGDRGRRPGSAAAAPCGRSARWPGGWAARSAGRSGPSSPGSGSSLELVQRLLQLPGPVGDPLLQLQVEPAVARRGVARGCAPAAGRGRPTAGWCSRSSARHGLRTRRWTRARLMASAASSSGPVPVSSTRAVRGECRWTQSSSCRPVSSGSCRSVRTMSTGRSARTPRACSAEPAVRTSNSWPSCPARRARIAGSSSTTRTEHLYRVGDSWPSVRRAGCRRGRREAGSPS